MYAVGEVIEAKFLLLNPSTGIVVTGASVSATVYDEADAEYSTPEVTEIGAGLYTASFTPDAAGEWTILFSCVDPNQTGGLCFPVGKGVVQDVEDKVDIVDANVDSVLADTNELQTDWANGGRLDLLIDAIKAETDKISNGTYGLSAIETLVDDLEGRLTATRAGYLDYLANATYGLSALNTNLLVVDSVADLIQVETDKIDVLESLIDSVMDLYRVGGTVTTDGTEQIIYISDNPSGLIKPMRFLIDTTNHTSDETVVLKFYYRVKNGGSYVVFSSATLSGVQSPLGVSYDLLPNAWGYKVTIEKTAGTNRAYDWEIFGGE